MKKILIILLLLLLQSCSTTVVNVEKNYFIIGDAVISGSELKDNNASQTSDGTLEIPLTK
jgi:hypothetical protein